VDIARRWRLGCAAVLGFVAVFAPKESAARATEVTAQLDYVAAPGCPGAGDLEGAVGRQLGYSPFRQNASQRVLVRIELSGQALEGRMEWRDADGRWMGERTFPSRSGDCGELVRAMGFALALQVQLMAAEGAAGPQPAAPPGGARATSSARVSATVGTTPAPPPSGTREGPRSRPAIAAGAGAGIGIGLAPTVVALGRAFGTVAWPHFALELGGEVSTPSAMHRADGAGFSEETLLGSVAICGLRIPFSACALTKVGEMRVAGAGVDAPASSSGVLLQAGLRVAVTHGLGRHVDIAAHADGVAALTRAMVTLNSMAVWTAPRVGGAMGIDLGVRFP
jgi:hypothetical protein